MSYIYLQEQEEVSSAESFSDIPAFVLLRLNLSAEISCFKGNERVSCQSFQSGTTCAHSTEGRGAGKLKPYVVDFLARTSASLEKLLVLEEKGADFGRNNLESFAKYDRASHSLKTPHCLLIEDSQVSYVTLPQWGMMRAGVCWAPMKLEYPNVAKEYGYLVNWPTPCAGNGKWGGTYQEVGGSLNWLRKTWIGRQKVNPLWWEWLMDWPQGWSDPALNPSATVKFQEWLSSHGRHCQTCEH